MLPHDTDAADSNAAGNAAGNATEPSIASSTDILKVLGLVDGKTKCDSSKQPETVPGSAFNPGGKPERNSASGSPPRELQEPLPELSQAEKEEALGPLTQHQLDSGEPSSSQSTVLPELALSSIVDTLYKSMLQEQVGYPRDAEFTMPGLEEIVAGVAAGEAGLLPTIQSAWEAAYGEWSKQIYDAAINGHLPLDWGPSFAPDMDSASKFVHLDTPVRFSDICPQLPLLNYFGFSFQGKRVDETTYRYEDIESSFKALKRKEADIRLYFIKTCLDTLVAAEEFVSIWRRLDVPPCIGVHISNAGGIGLGRRVSSSGSQCANSFYYLWFLLPVVNLAIEPEHKNPRGWRTGNNRDPVFIQTLKGWLIEDHALFFLKVDLTTREITVVVSSVGGGETQSKLLACCGGDKYLDLRDDPFAVCCCAYSGIMDQWAIEDTAMSTILRAKERFCLSLSEDVSSESEEQVKAAARELRQLLPFIVRQLESFECISRSLTEVIDEHRGTRALLAIPDDTFLRVEKNLKTLCSWSNSTKDLLKSRLRIIDTCLSTLSAVTSLKNDRAVSENTHHMARLAEYSREEGVSMGNIARATKLDSEAMKTIATLTMVYLPATFIATFFSMGFFNFDFDDGKRGDVGVSRYWWLYIAVALPLSGATFWVFSRAVKSQKNASEKESQKATPGA